jgi:hypothetical protein
MSDNGQPPERADAPDGVGALPGLVRLAATAWWHTAGWAIGTSLEAGRRIAEVTLAPQKAPRLAADVRAAARDTLRQLLDIADAPEREHAEDPHVPQPARNGTSPSTLRDQGAALLRLSRDVHYSEDAHPAYARILSELAPDEGRILQLLLLKGPQPAVDIRTGGPLGLLSSRLLAPGLTMIGARAGCRYVERTPSYLHNLFRLGMVWFSRETIQDPAPYQVLEAQPDVLEAIHTVKFAKIVRRSIHLTPFGEDFCRVSLWPESLDTAELQQLPEHSRPPEAEIAPARPPGVGDQDHSGDGGDA